MLAKIPGWMWVVSGVFSFIAAVVNIVGLRGFQEQALSHMTGATSNLGVRLAEGDFDGASHLGAVLASFLLGCVISGLLTGDSPLRSGREYGIALLLEATMLAVAVPLLAWGYSRGNLILACACGLQNAMLSTFTGLVVRTTHMTGIITDIGIQVGYALRRHQVDQLRLRMFLLKLGCFFTGALVGSNLFAAMGYATLLPLSAFLLVTGLIYIVRNPHSVLDPEAKSVEA